jgi:hypothetical protein
MDLEKLKFWKKDQSVEQPNSAEKPTPENRELAKRERYAQTQASKVIEKLNEGDVEKAHDLFIGVAGIMPKYHDTETQILIDDRVSPYIREKVIKAIVNGRGDELVQTLHRFHGHLRGGTEKVDFIRPEDLEQIPEEVLKSPEIIKKVHDHLIERFGHSPNTFDYELELYSKLGFITPEEIVKLPEIKEAANSLLRQSPMELNYSSSAVGDLRRLFRENTFDDLKKIILKLGILSETEIEQIRLNK